MANSLDVFKEISRLPSVSYSALTPNVRGLEDAITANVDEVAVFAAASESFSQKNINCSTDQSIERFKPLIEQALAKNLTVRGYVSCVVGCPYEGDISPRSVAAVAKQLFDLGCYEISLGDTIGVGTPKKIRDVIEAVASEIPRYAIAIHCHDTYGQAIANIYESLEADIRTFDSSVAGLGGCPYAAGASGNVASEDLVYLLQGLGLDSGIDLEKLITAGNFISQQLGRVNQSKVARAITSKLRASST
jgi:hydroxymethylglutaryl-CoA lyase